MNRPKKDAMNYNRILTEVGRKSITSLKMTVELELAQRSEHAQSCLTLCDHYSKNREYHVLMKSKWNSHTKWWHAKWLSPLWTIGWQLPIVKHTLTTDSSNHNPEYLDLCFIHNLQMNCMQCILTMKYQSTIRTNY